MKPPPAKIDNANVLWWAWAGDKPFGESSGIRIFGFAICRYESGALYRFICDKDWETVNDSPEEDEEGAKTRLPARFKRAAGRIEWRKFGE